MASQEEIQRKLEAKKEGITLPEDEILENDELKGLKQSFIVVSSNNAPGYEIVETCGFCYGLTVRSRGVGGQIGANLRSIVGGEIKEYVKMMEESRDDAVYRMIDHAQQMGANAVISVRYDSNEISNVMQEILAYGTAVIVREK
jgi:uncharacterized protein YbjQ (UPF0145 family)